jgi:GTP pyrophosphokinase
MITAETFEKAILFAVKAHIGQVRKGDGRPYILHPISVMQRISAIKTSSNIYLLGAAAILHDTVEDCGITLEEIAREFGHHVAALVSELTLDKSNYEKIGKAEYLARELYGMSSYALAIKLCDRLDNICDMKDMKKEFIARYIDETYFILKRIESRKLTKTHRKLIKMINKEIKKYSK